MKLFIISLVLTLTCLASAQDSLNLKLGPKKTFAKGKSYKDILICYKGDIALLFLRAGEGLCTSIISQRFVKYTLMPSASFAIEADVGISLIAYDKFPGKKEQLYNDWNNQTLALGAGRLDQIANIFTHAKITPGIGYEFEAIASHEYGALILAGASFGYGFHFNYPSIVLTDVTDEVKKLLKN